MSLADVVAVLQQKKSFLITGHVSPEGDVLGSGLALAMALRQMGKTAEVINKDPFPRQLLFLPHKGLFSQRETVTPSSEVLIVVDCGTLERTGYPRPLPAEILVNIDHHVTNPAFGDVNWVVPTATATGEMIYDLLKALGTEITPPIATALYTALATETGSFRYVNTSSKTLRMAAELIESGADLARIAHALYDANTSGQMQLLGEVLTQMEISVDDRLAWIRVTQSQLQRTRTTLEDTEDFVNYPRSIEKVEVAIFFREAGPDQYKISFRSQGKVDVALLAKRLGGGGHTYAAGCTCFGAWEQVKERVLSTAREAIYDVSGAVR
ncbi:MAG: bifunctional oligoribonuclease/PAP phosphatase NrnA [Nitrospirae bacterium]|nr:bifunctional oligoribonuclease/PAP phosphatase NrnA [Candidatus Manganitrophaceae bacterium]